ncbi:hypothetical protein HN784_05325 [bacterium]|nr:hypothetical protein [bacterium]MBT7037456.1 hypothetical protein [bacterium]MBT7432235.1 hypothetical protein [bacterium]
MKKISIIIVLLSIAILGIILVKSLSKPTPNKRLPIATVEKPNQYRDNNTPLNHFQIHDNITATIFWVGERASSSNSFISNTESAWDEDWSKHFGGVDDPEKRAGFYPAEFIPKENPFYFALPYNDLDDDGNRKKNANEVVFWETQDSLESHQSILKNRWAKIIANDKVAYGQWEDVGPFGEDDEVYVFGKKNPKSQKNDNAGIDLSPAISDYLGLNGKEKVSWQFIEEEAVPKGPWKEIITKY